VRIGLEGKVGATRALDVDTGGLKLRRTVEVNSVEVLMMNFDVVPVLTKEEVSSSLSHESSGSWGVGPRLSANARQSRGQAGNTVDCTVSRVRTPRPSR